MRRNKEFFIVLSISVTFFVLNISTISRFPTVWIDEVSYSDPAVNYNLGAGFVSTSWASQSNTEFWASNAPLHQFLLTPWLSLFGISITAVRSFDLFLFFLSSLILWLLMIKLQIGRRLLTRIIILLCFWCGEMISWIYRCGRPDVITILLALLTFWSYYYFLKPKGWLLIALIGFLSPIAGIQLPPFIVVTLFVFFLISNERTKIIRFGLLYSISVFAGLGCLLAFLYLKGVALRFLQMTFAAGYTFTGDIAQKVLLNDSKVNARISDKFDTLFNYSDFFTRDHSFLILFVLLTILFIYFLTKGTIKIKSVAFYGYLFSLSLPAIMLLLGRYPVYYSWMGYIIIILLTAHYLDLADLSKPIKNSCYLILIVTTFLGLPLQIIKSYITPNNDQTIIKYFIERNITKADIVYSDHITYYPLKRLTKECYFNSYSGGRGLPNFPAEQLNRINCIILSDVKSDVKIKSIWEREIWMAIDSIDKPKLVIYKKKL